MKRNWKTLILTISSISLLAASLVGQQIGEAPALNAHMDEADIESGKIAFPQIVQQGELLFTTPFNRLDGQGRPGTDSNGNPRTAQSSMIRTSGPEAHSCIACHNSPRAGGGGDFAMNVFELSDTVNSADESVRSQFGNERYTLSAFGSGPLDMLGREMTQALIAIRMNAISQAYLSAKDVPARLTAKGVEFGSIIAHPNGKVDASGVRGVSPDLVVRPFHQNGDTVSLRQVANDAMNQHLGMQSVEKFGLNVDADGDGVVNELTTGDITALAIFQAQLGTPGQVIPDDPTRAKAVTAGATIFGKIGCTDCHIPSMQLTSRLFTEPNPFNPEWKLPLPVLRRVSFDMTSQGELPRLEPTTNGGAIVRAYTDLKRHNLCDDQDSFFCNERVAQTGIVTNTFITRKLWDVGSAMAFGHRGDLSTLTEAINHHGGEARASQTNFSRLTDYQRAAIIEFLKSLQILPAGSPRVISESNLKLLKAEKNANLDQKQQN